MWDIEIAVSIVSHAVELSLKSDSVETRTLLTLPEVRTELWKSVFSGKAREKLFNGGARIGLF